MFAVFQGNLTRAPKRIPVGDGHVTQLHMMCDDRRPDGQGKWRKRGAMPVWVEVGGALGEAVAADYTSGAAVVVVGNWCCREWVETVDGEEMPHRRTWVRASTVAKPTLPRRHLGHQLSYDDDNARASAPSDSPDDFFEGVTG